MNILEIYSKYKIPEHLQLHMLRVASCVNLILDNLTENKVNVDSLIRIALLHDMGNMAKIADEEIEDEEFKKIRKKYIDEYGRNSHQINLIIAKKEGLKEEEIKILDRKSSKRGEETLNLEKYEVKILLYADQRVAPYGVTSLKERLEEVKQRYKEISNSVWSDIEKADHLIDCSVRIEEQIMRICKIQPQEINNESIIPYINKMKRFDINR